MKKKLINISAAKVKIFKIANRRGYAALSLNNLTEGQTPHLAYQRLIKALRRSGYQLSLLPADKVKRLVASKA
ncbi:MAG: hypothetical protein ABII75_02540 [Candidatus Omnitrophota bacterium]